jgi:hypothetical protein
MDARPSIPRSVRILIDRIPIVSIRLKDFKFHLKFFSTTVETMETQDMKDLNDSEWENRTLCQDGNCIGVIGEDGRCKECGLPYERTLPIKDSLCADSPAETQSPETPDTPTEPESQTDSPTANDEAWENRMLCTDGNCIGVISPEGVCKVCGKPYDT